MNKTLRKFCKNAKALSPVVASIILIAVTVAVSVVVAAWMGGMSIGLMGNAEQVSITNVDLTARDEIKITFTNTGGAASTISAFYINSVTVDLLDLDVTTIPKGTSATVVTVTYTTELITNYDFKVTTAKGNTVGSSALSPAA